ncbi:T9SS type A sorting domain-containing protein [candidate division KSB1 bacterium]|nr:T9SS type A sorting domain-containing protein [candidate division KSB1 bacterium]
MEDRNLHTLYFTVRVFSPLVLLFFFLNTFAQSIQVSGTVTASTTPVQNASITFIDSGDTTRQFSTLTNCQGEYSISILTSVRQQDHLPDHFNLDQNYPNPFSSVTAIPYRLDIPSDVYITIYDVLGREVKKVAMGVKAAGTYQFVWDGLNDLGESVATGMYFYRLQAGAKSLARKMIYAHDADHAFASVSGRFSQQPMQLNSVGKSMQQSAFTVRIANTAVTLPEIIPKQIENVVLQDNAILDFTVDEYINPNAAYVFLDSLQQYISGFGAANILNWRPDMTADNINKAFGTDDGQIGLTILRLRIPPDANGFAANVRTARAAYARGVTIIASPWSPPARMKTNNNLVGGRLCETAYADYAAHLKSFADYMACNGAPLFAISIQNEPDVKVTYESCDWNAAEMLKFVRENAPDIGTLIIAPESFNFNQALSDPILNDSTAASHVAIIGGHIYGGGLCSYPLAQSKGKEIWMTEHLDTDTSWVKVLATGKEINDCMFAGMNAYIWWYIVRFYGPIKEDGRVSKRGYVMSQFARFMRPGYFRVFATQRPQYRVYVTAYQGDSKVVIVVINLNTQPVEQTFVLKAGYTSIFRPYVTSIEENAQEKADIATCAGKLRVMLPPSSVTTFVSQ